jgi:hypothetical protein
MLADAGDFVPLRDALAFLPELVLSGEEAAAIRNGRRIRSNESASGEIRLTHDGELLAIGDSRAGEVRPVVVFAPA